jgi:hypothetical protein
VLETVDIQQLRDKISQPDHERRYAEEPGYCQSGQSCGDPPDPSRSRAQRTGSHRPIPLQRMTPVVRRIPDIVERVDRDGQQDEGGSGTRCPEQRQRLVDHPGRDRRREEHQAFVPLLRSAEPEQRPQPGRRGQPAQFRRRWIP